MEIVLKYFELFFGFFLKTFSKYFFENFSRKKEFADQYS